MPQHYKDEFQKRSRETIESMMMNPRTSIAEKRMLEDLKKKKKDKKKDKKKAPEAGEALKEQRRKEQLDALKEVKGSKELTGILARKFLKENQKRKR